MKTKTTILIAIIFIIVASGCADQARKYIRSANYVGASASTGAYMQFYDWAETEDGTLALCKDLLDAHMIVGPDGKKIMDPAYSESDLKGDCAAKIHDFEKKFDDAMSMYNNAAETLDYALDIWKDIDDKNKMKAIEDVLRSLVRIVDIIKLAGVEVPVELNQAVAGIETALDMFFSAESKTVIPAAAMAPLSETTK